MDTENDTAGDDAEDNALLTELRALAALQDPVPLEAVAAARSAIAWRTMDVELAELTTDAAPAGIRGATAPTVLSFDASDVSIEIEILDSPGGRRFLGQLVPPGPGIVQVRHRDGTAAVAADEVGRFSIDNVARGPVSLRCEVDGRIVETDWFIA